jgi:diacylglycerol kinase
MVMLGNFKTGNMKTNSFSLKARGRSFLHAFNGIIKFFAQEPNMLIHLFATITAFAVAVYFGITKDEFLVLIIVTGFVWVAELFNTVIERIMDFISPEHHPEIKFIKDVSAGAVLLAALTAVISGAIIFIPEIFKICQ